MSQKKKLRLTKSLSEVQNAFKATDASADITLWYLVNEERILFTGQVVRVDPELNKIVLTLKDPVPALDGQSQCFLKLFRDEGVSSCKINQLKGRALVLELPEEMVMTERRRNWRAQFNKLDQKSATLRFGDIEHVFEVMNASKAGLAIRLDDRAKSLIQTDPEPKIIKLNGVRLDDMTAGIVLHPSGQSLGLNLRKEIPDEVFNEFIHVDRPVEVDPKKLYLDQSYRTTVRDNMKQVVSKLEKKSKLAAALKLLKVNREGTAYLKNHIELLCETMGSIGKTLGWVTDGSLEKLVYVAYMHDIHYFEHPHLAKIPDLETFELKKASLSPAEQKIYFDGPAYAAMLAAEDDNNSPDVEKILMQQKERPDGTGFPAGLRSHQLAPLSCLFIVCHEFVDYVLTETKWSFREFVMRFRPDLKGPYFAKIFQVMMDLDKAK